jgi:hypothetical protein
MSIRKDGRCMIQLTMAPDLYEAVRDHCKRQDTPVTVWARELIRQALSTESPPPLNTP